MTERARRSRFAAPSGRRREPDQVARGTGTLRPTKNGAFTARLTIDVTPGLRGRIKVAAFQRGITVADMLRDLLRANLPRRSRRHRS